MEPLNCFSHFSKWREQQNLCCRQCSQLGADRCGLADRNLRMQFDGLEVGWRELRTVASKGTVLRTVPFDRDLAISMKWKSGRSLTSREIHIPRLPRLKRLAAGEVKHGWIGHRPGGRCVERIIRVHRPKCAVICLRARRESE
jgi:hypothetical protein